MEKEGKMTRPHGTEAAIRGEILVVEDTPSSLALLSDLLAREGYTVREAPDGDLALWSIRARAPDLVLLDIRMPSMDGFEVCRRLKADPATADIPVIFLSALDDVEDKVRGLGLGAVDYVSKPYQAEEVLARVRTHLKLLHLSRELATACNTLEERVRERTEELSNREREMTRILTALDMAGDGIMIIDANNRISYANQTMLATIGIRTIGEIIGHRSDEIFSDSDDRPIFDLPELKAARDAVRCKGTWRGELSIRRPSAEKPNKLLVHIRELTGGERVAVATDITETRRREEQQRRLVQQLEQARKLEALGQLAGGIAHDFNNLLGAILGFAQFIVEDSPGDTSHHRYAGRILKAGQQAKSLIGQILAFSHHRESEAELIDVGALIKDAMSILKATVTPSTEIEFINRASGITVLGQRTQLTQVVVNLCTNASSALAGKMATVTIEIALADSACTNLARLIDAESANSQGQPKTEAWTDQNGQHHVGFGVLQHDTRYLTLSISDGGEGMTFDVACRIFEPFFTTKGKTGGTGLGLAMVHGIVTNHRGGVLVHTSPATGSRFDVLLPVASAATVAKTKTATLERVLTTGTRQHGRILLVDDSADFRDMLTTALSRLGYNLTAHSDPLEALNTLRANPAAWDVVITDQAMPHMTGTNLVTAIKAIRADLPCIICTAFPGELNEETAVQIGVNGFATKPIDIGQFSAMVANVITRRG